MEEELVFASSSIGSAIGCWAIESGKEQQLPYKSCGSTPPHGLSFVGSRFLASSQFSDHTASFGSIIYCSLSKVPTGRLLQQWHAHLRPITCLVFSDDDSLLVSAAEDGCVRVWPLLTVVGVQQRDQASNLYLHSFAEHTLPITDLVMGHGGGNAVIISASRTGVASTLDKSDWPHIIGSFLVKGPVNNILVMKRPQCQNDSSVVAKIEVEKLKHDCAEYKQMLDKWKRRYDALHEFCMDELLAGDRPPKRLVRPLSSDHKSKSFGGNSG
ncbi:unnamed protein product [Linum tenue]|uniref:Uncharacterized protein n=1 Tax=Linum tenue TaxID=586396 RepID=A0AAV0RN02_9ROSI|nr:unnamed protein product [Linum tenue]